MSRVRVAAVLAFALIVGSSWSLRADVKTDEKSRVQFAGALGKIVNFFGGKAAREGVTSTVAVKGDRKSTTVDKNAKIIDLNEEKIYDLDLDKKTYKVTTFDELRRKMEEDRKRAEEQARRGEERNKKAEKEETPQKEMQVDFDVKETGQKKAINGFDTKEVVMTITVREKGKTLEQSGGLVLTSDMWMTPTIAAMKEISEFNVRYAQKLAGPTLEGASPEQLAMALAQYPSMKDAIAKMRAEGGKLQGTPIQTTTTFDAVKSAEQMEQEKQSSSAQDESSAQGGVGGMLGGFARKMAKKKSDNGDDQPKARSTVMTIENEVLKVTPAVTAADVSIPADFKQK